MELSVKETDGSARRSAIRIWRLRSSLKPDPWLIVWGVVIVLLPALTSVRVRERVEGIYSIETDQCSVDIFTPPAQKELTIALACRGVDYIRLWPLPPMKPWLEDEAEPQFEALGEMRFAVDEYGRIDRRQQ